MKYLTKEWYRVMQKFGGSERPDKKGNEKPQSMKKRRKDARFFESSLAAYGEHHKKEFGEKDPHFEEEMDLHDSHVISCREDDGDMVIAIDNSGSFFGYGAMILKDCTVIKREKPLEGACFLYKEIYRSGDRYELHFMLDKNGLFYFTVTCSDVEFTDRPGMKEGDTLKGSYVLNTSSAEYVYDLIENACETCSHKSPSFAEAFCFATENLKGAFAGFFEISPELVSLEPTNETLEEIFSGWFWEPQPRTAKSLIASLESRLGKPLGIFRPTYEEKLRDALGGSNGLSPFYFVEDIFFARYGEMTACFMMGNCE
ncbi:MAG: DUF4085 family protein [Clostridia bacterium]|nr:DUF4085 family protein [Clostridia bacterium]